MKSGSSFRAAAPIRSSAGAVRRAGHSSTKRRRCSSRRATTASLYGDLNRPGFCGDYGEGRGGSGLSAANQIRDAGREKRPSVAQELFGDGSATHASPKPDALSNGVPGPLTAPRFGEQSSKEKAPAVGGCRLALLL